MTDDTLLAERLSLLVDPPAAGDWADVRRRIGRARRRRTLATFAIVTAALAIAAPAALGLRGFVDFFSAEPAPEHVRLDFARLDLGAPKGMATGVIAGETRKVPVQLAGGGQTFVWVAPTRKGGFCYLWAHQVGGCRTRSGGVGAGFSTSRLNAGAATIGRIHGATTLGDARRLVLRFADDTRVELPLTWVSAPIGAAFYSYDVPVSRQATPRRPEELLLYGEGDHVIARQTFPTNPQAKEDLSTGLPKAVLYEQRREVLSISTEQGKRIVLFAAPSRLSAPSWDGTCMWLSDRDGPMYRAFFGCGNPFPNTPSISAGILGGTKPVLLAGAVGEDVTRLQLRFEDGDTIELPAVDGYVLGELPTRHYPPGARLTLAIARDATGAEVGRKSFETTLHGTYPCAPADEIDLGLGVTTCP